MPKEVLTPLRDHDPCQGRDTHARAGTPLRDHGPPQDRDTPGPWPTGDPRWNKVGQQQGKKCQEDLKKQSAAEENQ